MVDRRRIKIQPKDQCKVIGICAGCFTILTPNHVLYLEEARMQCDYLIVLTNFDDYVKDKKGAVPLSCEDRLVVLQSLKAVSETSAFEGENEQDWVERFMRVRLQEFAPDAKVTLFHDQSAMLGVQPDNIVGFGVANKLVMIARKEGTSVSDIFERIKNG